MFKRLTLLLAAVILSAVAGVHAQNTCCQRTSASCSGDVMSTSCNVCCRCAGVQACCGVEHIKCFDGSGIKDSQICGDAECAIQP